MLNRLGKVELVSSLTIFAVVPVSRKIRAESAKANTTGLVLDPGL